jgi:hypothetical protein
MLKDQKYQMVADRCVRNFRTYEQADTIRKTTADALKKAKDKTTKVKVRLRPSGLFDVMVYQPVQKAEAA